MKVIQNIRFVPDFDRRGLVVPIGPTPAIPIVIAYATEPYFGALQNLEYDCNNLGLCHNLIRIFVGPVSGVAHRRVATHIKSHFVEWCLNTYNRPVWYFDADTRLKAAVPEVPPIYWSAFHRQPSRDKLGFPVRSSMFFLRPGKTSSEFLRQWHDAHKPELEDHTPLCRVWKAFAQKNKSGMLEANFSDWTVSNGTKVETGRK